MKTFIYECEHGYTWHLCVFKSELSKWNLFNKESFWSVICPWGTFCVLRMLELTVDLADILCDLWSLYAWPFLWDWYMLCVPYVGRILLVPKERKSHHICVVVYWSMCNLKPHLYYSSHTVCYLRVTFGSLCDM